MLITIATTATTATQQPQQPQQPQCLSVSFAFALPMNQISQFDLIRFSHKKNNDEKTTPLIPRIMYKY